MVAFLGFPLKSFTFPGDSLGARDTVKFLGNIIFYHEIDDFQEMDTLYESFHGTDRRVLVFLAGSCQLEPGVTRTNHVPITGTHLTSWGFSP